MEEAVRLLNEAGFRVIVVANQRGIALGRTTEERVQEIHRRMIEHLAGAGARIDAVYYCPHDEGGCGCRKPGVGLFLQAREEFPGLDFRHSFVIGDSPVDIEAGQRLGCRTVTLGAWLAARRSRQRHQVERLATNREPTRASTMLLRASAIRSVATALGI